MDLNRIFCWVIALKPEAEGVIERYSLKKDQELSRHGFEVFISEEHALIISGVGKVNVAAAVSWLGAQISNSENLLLWLNFGIAGNKEHPIGTLLRAGRIKDWSTERSWYPHNLKQQKNHSIKLSEVLTVEQPCFNYPEPKWLVDMEAAGFIAIAVRFSSLEWIQCFKVVSDNENSDPNLIKPNLVDSLCRNALAEIDQWLNLWDKVAKTFLKNCSQVDCEPILAEYHFTETEKHQLHRLMQRAVVLEKIEPDNCLQWAKSCPENSGKALLKRLRQLLANTESTEN